MEYLNIIDTTTCQTMGRRISIYFYIFYNFYKSIDIILFCIFYNLYTVSYAFINFMYLYNMFFGGPPCFPETAGRPTNLLFWKGFKLGQGTLFSYIFLYWCAEHCCRPILVYRNIMEYWNFGILANWNIGTLVSWEPGNLGSWGPWGAGLSANNLSLRTWEPGGLGAGEPGSLAAWILGKLEALEPGSLGPTEGGIFEARVSPGSFLYLYIFLHLFHMFLYMLFIFFV